MLCYESDLTIVLDIAVKTQWRSKITLTLVFGVFCSSMFQSHKQDSRPLMPKENHQCIRLQTPVWIYLKI
jgi:hypothetical protein